MSHQILCSFFNWVTCLFIIMLYESEICSVMSNSLWPHGVYSPWNSIGQNTGVGSCSLLQGIFPTQGSNPGLPHCMSYLYILNTIPLSDIWFANVFVFCGLFSLSWWCSLQYKRNFDKVWFIFFFGLCIWCHNWKPWCNLGS